jgi:tetratricopeptide (TPR) repeat protein
VGQIHPNQRRGQPHEILAFDQFAQCARVVGEPELSRGREHAIVGKRVEFVPDDLHLAEEDVGAHRPDALELLQQRPLACGLATSQLAQATKVAPILVEHQPRSLAEHRRGFLVVALVSVRREDRDALLPARSGHRSSGGQLGIDERPGGTGRVRGMDGGAEQQGQIKQWKQHHFSPTLDSDASLVRVGAAVVAQEHADDRSLRRHGEQGSKRCAIATRTSVAPSISIEPLANPDANTEQTSGAVAETIAASDPALPIANPDADLPERLGRYVVLDKLGEGGMGVVFTAYDPDIDRKLAIKLLHASASPAAQERLRRECQAMGQLSHPNVVQVFDVGEFQKRVYVAMDYVPGSNLRDWLDTEHDWHEVLEVFIAAGRGLAHAHAHDIVHRDFKPDNVIVSEVDGERTVKVLDFGLAKSVEGETPSIAADPELELATIEERPQTAARDSRLLSRGDNSRLSAELTRLGAIMGTPAYMSPEQHRGAPTNAASDQFSFCVALYEGLWGRRPYEGTTLKSLAFAVVSGKRQPPPSHSKVPAWVWPIVSRGLEVAPERRWPSMNALLAALAHDPTQDRRRVAILALAGVSLAAVIAWGVLRGPASTEAPPKCQGAAAALAEVWSDSQAATIRDRYAAREEAWASNVGAEVQMQLRAWAERWSSGRTSACEATEVRGEQSAELMDLRIACYDRKLAELAPTVALLSEGDVALLGKGVELVSALPPLELCDDADALRAAVPPPEDQQIAAEVAAIHEELAQARSLAKAGQAKPALERVEAVLERADRTKYAPLIAETMLRHGALLITTGEMDRGRATLEGASMAAIATRDDDLAGRALEELIVQVGYNDGDYEGGMRWARLAQALASRAAEPSMRRRAELAEQIGMVEFQAGHFDKAREQIALALELLTELDGPEHPSFGNPLNVMGATHLRSGNYQEAGEYFERALAITERAYGPTHPNVATSLNNLALVYERLAEFDKAAEVFRRVIAILEAAHGEAHPNVGLIRMNLGGVLLLAGRREEAGPELTRAVEILEAALGPEHQIVGRALTMRGDWERESGEFETALASYQRSVAIRKAALGEDHPDLSLSLLGVGQALIELGRAAEAVRELDRAVALLDRDEADPIDRGLARFHLARALAASDQPERIPALLDAARLDFKKGGIRAKGDLDKLEAWAREPERSGGGSRTRP